MSQVISHRSGADWSANGPTTRTQRFFQAYVNTVDGKGYEVGSGLKFYSKDVVFHNQNGAVYRGGDEMWAWMKQLFGAFESMRHDWVQFTEIQREDGTSMIYSQNVRNIWTKGNTGEEPTVSVPMVFIAVIGENDGSEETPEGLDFKEAWIYWDTALLLPFLNKEAVVFSKENILTGGAE